MSTDIHMFCEVKIKYHWIEDRWECIGHSFPNPDYRGEINTIFEDARHNGQRQERDAPYTIHPYMRQNYELFALLAGVRAYINRNLKPIAEPRGWPEDCSHYLKTMDVSWGHDHSWLTYDELNQHGREIEKIDPYFHNVLFTLADLKQRSNVEDVRVVFFFDS